jgi:hypothetical protein
MENNSFCQRVIEAANARPGKVAMTLIGQDGAETITFGEMLSQIRSVAYRLIQEQIAFGDRAPRNSTPLLRPRDLKTSPC